MDLNSLLVGMSIGALMVTLPIFLMGFLIKVKEKKETPPTHFDPYIQSVKKKITEPKPAPKIEMIEEK